MATESGSSFEACWSSPTASVHSPLILQAAGRGIQADRLESAAILHGRGPERDGEAGRIVAGLAEELGDLRPPARRPRGGTAGGRGLHLSLSRRPLPAALGRHTTRPPARAIRRRRSRPGISGPIESVPSTRPLCPLPLDVGFLTPPPPRTRVHRVRRPTQHPEPGCSHAPWTERLPGIGCGGSTSPRRLLNPMIPVVRVSYHGTARAAKSSGAARFASEFAPHHGPLHVAESSKY